MLDSITKKKIDDARDILVGKVPVPSSQVEQITIALIYKFMYDMDNESIELGGNPKYFAGDFAQYAWNKLFDQKLSGEGRVMLYQDALAKIPNNSSIPTLFRDIFKNAFLPYRDPETLKLFLKCIDEFTYEHSEKLGDAFEYLLAVLGSQGDAGQFRTPRHIIDFMVELIDPQKEDSILDPACGTAGFLISAYKHIIKTNSSNYDKDTDPHTFAAHGTPLDELVIQNGKKYNGDLLTPDQRAFLHKNLKGYDIAFEMVRLSMVNMYLHGFNTPQIYEYDTLTSTDRWNEYANVILANPPFMTPKGGIRPHQKFTIQAKRSEILFVDYMLEHLTNNGRAGIIVPEGIIFQGGNAYKQLRKLLVEENYLVGVVSLPSGVFNPYSGVKTSILWIDKALAKRTDKIIFLKVNNDGFDLGAQRRPIEASNLPTAFANAMAYKKAVLSGAVYQVPEEDVILVEKTRLAESNDYNLSGERYVVGAESVSEYSLVPLSSLCRIRTGKKDVNQGNPNGKYPFFTCARDYTFSDTFSFDCEALLVAGNGVVGDVKYYKGMFEAYQRTYVLDDFQQINPIYLFFLLRIKLPDYLQNLKLGNTMPYIKLGMLQDFQIPLPPLSVQEEIVAELDSYKKIIDGAKQVVDNWKPCFDIDPKWDLIQLGQVATVIAGQSPEGKYYNNSKEGLPFYQGKTEFQFINLGKPKSWTTQITKTSYANDIVMSVRAPVGPVNLVSEDICIGRGLAAIRCTDKMNFKFCFYYLKHIEKAITGTSGSTFSSINKSDIEKIIIPLPDLKTQQDIIDQIDRELSIVDANRYLVTLYEHKINDRICKLWKD